MLAISSKTSIALALLPGEPGPRASPSPHRRPRDPLLRPALRPRTSGRCGPERPPSGLSGDGNPANPRAAELRRKSSRSPGSRQTGSGSVSKNRISQMGPARRTAGPAAYPSTQPSNASIASASGPGRGSATCSSPASWSGKIPPPRLLRAQVAGLIVGDPVSDSPQVGRGVAQKGAPARFGLENAQEGFLDKILGIAGGLRAPQEAAEPAAQSRGDRRHDEVPRDGAHPPPRPQVAAELVRRAAEDAEQVDQVGETRALAPVLVAGQHGRPDGPPALRPPSAGRGARATLRRDGQ